jgi:hypothetical protein
MAQNLIRLKQINQSDLSGAVQNVIASNEYQITYGGGTGININDVGQITISGTDIYLIDNVFNVSGTGVFNALDLNNIDTLSLSGVDITITNGNVILTNPVSAPNLVYNTGNQTISGVKTFSVAGSTIARISQSGLNVVSGNLTVGGTGVLLTGKNSFILTLAHSSDSSLNLGNNFFGNMFGAPTSSSLNSRKFNVLETCVARKFTWTNYVGTVGSAAGINATGYFINATKQITGTLTTALSNNSANSQQLVYGAISPPIAISDGDEVAASIGYISGGVGTLPTAVRNNVNIYCYN